MKSYELSNLFNPKTIAIVGASSDLTKPGARLMAYCLKFEVPAKLFPINPNRPEVMGKKAFHTVTEVSDDIDVACVAIPRQAVQTVIEDCVAKKVKFIVVFSAGFSEIGNREQQTKLVQTAKDAGCRVMGPNCQGLISSVNNVIVSYHSCLDTTPVKGKIALVTQSGALGGYLTGAFWERKIGISHFVSTGNESDLETSEFIDFLVADSNTKVIALFLEGAKNGTKFREAAEKALQAKKPIIVLKTGKSEKGRQSALTHTGAMTGSDKVYDALFKQLGILRVKTMEDLIEGAVALASQPLPAGNRIAFISPSGAACSLVSDVSEELGLKIADLSDKTLARIKSLLPDMAVAKNPLDVVYVYGNPNARTMIGDLIEAMAIDPNVDMVIPGLTIGGRVADEVVDYGLESIRKVRERTGKPVLFWWATDRNSFARAESLFSKNEVPLYTAPERAVNAASVMFEYANHLQRRTK
jgi:acyl-CoA synthetase (NDP forming)